MNYFPYHPAYGVDDSTRLKALELSKEIGIRNASTQLNVSTASIYKWRKDVKEMTNV